MILENIVRFCGVSIIIFSKLISPNVSGRGAFSAMEYCVYDKMQVLEIEYGIVFMISHI
jgi:hypothetical protein